MNWTGFIRFIVLGGPQEFMRRKDTRKRVYIVEECISDLKMDEIMASRELC
jgi:hypothetical protein